MPTSATLLAAAQDRITLAAKTDSVAASLSHDERLHAAELIVETARIAKTSIKKLSDKKVYEALNTAWAAQNEADAQLQYDMRNGECPEPRQGTPVEKVVRIDRKNYPADDNGEPVRKTPSVRGSHAECSHANTKVARAKCRRARAAQA